MQYVHVVKYDGKVMPSTNQLNHCTSKCIAYFCSNSESSTPIDHHPHPLTITHTQWPSPAPNDHHSHPMTITHTHWPSPTPLTITHTQWPSPTPLTITHTTDHHPHPPTITHTQWPSGHSIISLYRSVHHIFQSWCNYSYLFVFGWILLVQVNNLNGLQNILHWIINFFKKNCNLAGS